MTDKDRAFVIEQEEVSIRMARLSHQLLKPREPGTFAYAKVYPPRNTKA